MPPVGGQENGVAFVAESRAAGSGHGTLLLDVSVLLASLNASDAGSRHAAMTVKPRNGGIGLLEFRQLDRVCEAGRAAPRDALEDAPDQIFG